MLYPLSHPFSDNLSEKSKFEDNEVSIVEINAKLENAVTAKQESEAKLISMETKLKAYETELTSLKEKVNLCYLLGGIYHMFSSPML